MTTGRKIVAVAGAVKQTQRARVAVIGVTLLVLMAFAGTPAAWADGLEDDNYGVVDKSAMAEEAESFDDLDSPDTFVEGEQGAEIEAARQEDETTGPDDEAAQQEDGATSPDGEAAQQEAEASDPNGTSARQATGNQAFVDEVAAGDCKGQASSTAEDNQVLEPVSETALMAQSEVSTNAIETAVGTTESVNVFEAQATVMAPIADGDYYIRANTATRSLLDVAGASRKSGANVWLYEYNGTVAQKWHLKFDAKTGYYTITSLVAGMALDISGASTRDGANVQAYKPNGTDAQKWKIIADGSSWRLESALKKNFVLDIAGAGSSNGTNVQGYRANGTKAQKFDFLAVNPSVEASTATIAEGAYILKCVASKKVLDVAGASRKSSANVQQYAGNSTYAQRFYFEPDGKGYYRIFNIGSGLALDVASAGKMPGTNVQQYAFNGTAAQQWSVKKNKDKTYTFVSAANGLVLDVSGASTQNGANVQMWVSNGTKAQQFTLSATGLLSTGVVKLNPVSSLSKSIAVKSGSTSSGAAMQISNQSETSAQKLVVTKSGDGCVLQPVCSGLYVSASGSAVVQNRTQTIWKASYSKKGSRRGIVLANPGGMALTASGTANGLALKTASASSGASSQSFCPSYGTLIDNGSYIVSSAVGGKVLDAAGGKRVNNTNIQIYDSNGTNAQKYSFASLGGEWYTISNASSRRALDVAGGSDKSGANVQLYKANGTNAQKWRAELLEGGYFRFVNATSGKALDVKGSRNANGTNVQVADCSDSQGQKFRLISTSLAREGVDLGVPSVWQNPELPTGCESVALTNVLKYYGFPLSKTEIADNYMTWSEDDFVYSFMGNPHSSSGAAIMAPGITSTANRYLSSKGSSLWATNITGTSFNNLYSYIDAGVPVVVWSTMYFGDRGSAYASSDGYTMYGNTHAVTLAGYNEDKSYVLVSDPLSGSVWREAGRFRYLYNKMGKQAVVVQ